MPESGACTELHDHLRSGLEVEKFPGKFRKVDAPLGRVFSRVCKNDVDVLQPRVHGRVGGEGAVETKKRGEAGAVARGDWMDQRESKLGPCFY